MSHEFYVADLDKALLARKGLKEARRGSMPATTEAERPSPVLASMKEPGGMRRDFLNRRASEEGVPREERPESWQRSMLDELEMNRWQPLLEIGYFDAMFGIRIDPQTGAEVHTAPLPGRADLSATTLALVKSFIGGCITFMPGAFRAGGWLFSLAMVLSVGFGYLLTIRLLLDCREQSGLPSLSEMALAATGRAGSLAVQISLALCQSGAVIASMVFIAAMVKSLGFQVSHYVAVFAQLVILVPLSLIRRVDHLRVPNLVANTLILACLAIVVLYTFRTLAASSVGLSERILALKTFDPRSCGLCLGIVISAFEGVPVILPIRESMREPERFWPLFQKIFAAVVLLFAAFGILGYAAFGRSTSAVVLQDLPAGGIAMFVQGAYIIALISSVPLQFLPAARVIELWVFGEVTPDSLKWQKNMLRSSEMLGYAIAGALFAGPYFQKLLALIGSLCCLPIAFIYPALFHMRLCSPSLKQKVLDALMVALGIVAMSFSLWQSLD